jgi:hypothetical protein
MEFSFSLQIEESQLACKPNDSGEIREVHLPMIRIQLTHALIRPKSHRAMAVHAAHHGGRGLHGKTGLRFASHCRQSHSERGIRLA